MPILQYSGRGRGFRGKGRGFPPPSHSRNTYVRPPSYASSSFDSHSYNRKWKRSQSHETSDSVTKEADNGAKEGVPKDNNGSPATRSASSSPNKTTTEQSGGPQDSELLSSTVVPNSVDSQDNFAVKSEPTTTRRPVLKGPSLMDTGRHVWKRSKNADEVPCKSNTSQNVDRPANLQSGNDVDSAHFNTMQKIGKNKLVVKAKFLENGESSVPPLQKIESQKHFLYDGNGNYTGKTNAKRSWQRPFAGSKITYNVDAGHSQRAKPAPKRIKLLVNDSLPVLASVTEGDSNAEELFVGSSHELGSKGAEEKIAGLDRDDESELEKGKMKNEVGKEKYTDFAYRETSRRGPTSMNRTWGRGKSQQKVKNMGLVRIQTDDSKTPICPTFLRGVACTDEKCLKRHDVPKEFALPVCSFFQRQGMCWKQDAGTCPFRHIKVNPRATECPSFSLLGYCEDKDCAMMHSRRKQGSLKKHF